MEKLPVASHCSSAESYSATSRCYLKIAIAKRCRLHKLIRQRFALALRFSRKTLRLFNQSQSNQQAQDSAVARREEAGEVKRINQSQDSVASFQQKRKRSSSRLESAGAKQLTTYEELQELDVNC
ncbi:hypothetical protein F511_36862 [Dorcoceras hygrometricum]|uniref:Uncharacterized protein n=1 Tax=Dorcoceras hygrometricum TaxID=472368 RepID=A0A2Z7CIW5_9LAMI|nr:hypothetical protein F511_36862 [Dorcoceras hygrometricum]